MTKHLEIKTIEYGDISVAVKIDYDAETVSLVEAGPKNQGIYQWTPKQWVFNKRGIEYMKGWLDIMSAMMNAVVVAQKDLQEYLDAKSKAKEDLLIKAALKKDE